MTNKVKNNIQPEIMVQRLRVISFIELTYSTSPS